MYKLFEQIVEIVYRFVENNVVLIWNDLKEIHSEITFCKNKNGKQYLTITLPLREVIDIVDCNKLSRFVNKYINY